MTAEEHFTEAERLLDEVAQAVEKSTDIDFPMELATLGVQIMQRDVTMALAHATLAHARFQQVKR